MTDQTTTLNIEQEKDKTFSKEEVSTICNVSINTLQNWLNDEKAEDSDFIRGKQGKRIYYLSYLKRVFKKAFREDLIPVLENSQTISKDSQRLGDGLPEFDFQELLTQQTETIKILQEQVEDLKNDKKNLNEQIAKLQRIIENQQTLSLQQNQHTNLLLNKSKPKGFLGWFGMNSQKEDTQG